MSAVLWIHEYLKILENKLNENNENKSVISQALIQQLSSILEPILTLLSHEEEEIRRAANKTNEIIIKIIKKLKDSSTEFMKAMNFLKEIICYKSSPTAEAALVWMNILLSIYN